MRSIQPLHVVPRTLGGLCLGFVFGVSCGPEAPAPDDLNALLIVVDTLGAEHMGAYGGAARTPNLDRLAEGGVLFEDAIATAPWTQPSIASLFTSLMPSQHGVVKLRSTLGEEMETLSEVLQARGGLRTHGVVSHVLISPETGFAQGFLGFDTRAVAGHEDLTSERVTDGALEFLERFANDAAAGENFFLFAHYFDPHYVYRTHAAYAHAGAQTGERADSYDGPVRPGMPIWDLRDMRAELSPRDVEYLVGLYHEEIAYTDFHIGRLLDYLRGAGLERNTLVVFTADHGEEFMGHGWIGHTRTLFDELVRVPLILSLPGTIDAGVVSTPVSLLDVAPSITQLLGAGVPDAWEGRTLLPFLKGSYGPNGSHGSHGPRARGSSETDRYLFSEVSYGPKRPTEEKRASQKQAHKTALVFGELKLIHDQLSGTWELYRRDTDPGEQHDLSATLPETLASLKQELNAWEAALADETPWRDTPEIDGELLEELRSLGYVR